ncbi:hypothetical protein JVX91_04180 [Pseudomonas sp. PDNC002]|uniref:DUF2867 domain-containing protein n=1 Tax=Pseudomonas sp. PDNC002 TaxID=2811422 RepID=UPI001962C28E|nr:DUF2867 domain-containing protein [Pseudomonas sp. PDNC002]QRY80329.1 hypothetical protein JVX91_04180 [Pseudomonas sp. PDNC002]
MELLERLLPDFQFSERHSRDMRATPTRVLDAVTELTAEHDPLASRFLQIREAPARLALRLGLRNALADRPRFGLHEFTLLGRNGDRELAYGLIGRFWRSDFGLRPCADGESFRHFSEPGTARLMLHFSCDPGDGDGTTRVRTETRVHCPDARSQLLFAPYWLAIRPVSGLIRRRLLRDIERRASEHS